MERPASLMQAIPATTTTSTPATAETSTFVDGFDQTTSRYFSRTIHLEENEIVLNTILQNSGYSTLQQLMQNDKEAFLSMVPARIEIQGDTDLINANGDTADLDNSYVAFDLQVPHGRTATPLFPSRAPPFTPSAPP